MHRNISSNHVFLGPPKKSNLYNIALGGFANKILREEMEKMTKQKYSGEDFYLAPEVAVGGRPYTQASDRWALGMLLREMTSIM